MLKKNARQRDELFKDIKEKYEAEIATYDMSLDKLLDYLNAYLWIATLLEGMDTDRAEISIRLGQEFDKWFFETHDQIMSQFWEEGAQGFRLIC